MGELPPKESRSTQLSLGPLACICGAEWEGDFYPAALTGVLQTCSLWGVLRGRTGNPGESKGIDTRKPHTAPQETDALSIRAQ